MITSDPDLPARLAEALAPPSPAALTDAPALRKWNPVTWPGEDATRLEGYVTGHPTITDPRWPGPGKPRSA